MQLSTTPIANLTSRKKEILILIAQGFSNPEIAKRLGRSESTVENHVTDILVILNVKNRTEAAVLAAMSGLLGDIPLNGQTPYCPSNLSATCGTATIGSIRSSRNTRNLGQMAGRISHTRKLR